MKRSFMLVLVLLLLLLLLQMHVFADGDDNQENYWSEPIQISDSQIDYHNPVIAVNNTTLHVVYVEWDGNGIFYKRSFDNGVTWEEKRLLVDSRCAEPAIAVYSDNVHIVWADYRNNPPGEYSNGSEIYYKRSIDGGDTWSDDIRLSDSDAYWSQVPDIVCNEYIIHIVWGDARDSAGTIYYGYGGAIYHKKSIDNGETWTNDTKISDTDVKAFVPSLDISGNYVYVTWNDRRDWVNDEIFFKRSTDQGVTWTNDTRLTFSENISSYATNIKAEDNYVYITWEEHSIEGICILKSENYGNTWGNIVPITTMHSFSGIPNIDVHINYIHIAFQKGNYLYYCRSIDYGENWENIKKLTFNNLVLSFGELYVENNYIHFILSVSGQNKSIFYMSNSNFGEGNIIIDIDGDWIENSEDDFPEDPAASIDSDNDGYPDEWNPWRTAEDSTTGLHLDVFPNSPEEWNDTDGDGIGDNSDAFPTDLSEWQDTDGDGVGDRRDVFPEDPKEWDDTDNDLVGDNSDAYPFDITRWKKEDSINEDLIWILVGIVIITIWILMLIILTKRESR